MWIAVAAIVLFCLFPFYWLVNISLKTGPDLSSADLFPPNPSLENYKSIFQNDDFTRALANSAIVALVTTFIGIVVGSFAAYALEKKSSRQPQRFGRGAIEGVGAGAAPAAEGRRIPAIHIDRVSLPEMGKKLAPRA
jgi:ABC-type spermidine/putrescine transport system permease subunit II